MALFVPCEGLARDPEAFGKLLLREVERYPRAFHTVRKA